MALIRDLANGNHPTQRSEVCTREGGRLVIFVFLSLIVFVCIFDLVLVVAEDSVSDAGTLSLLFISALAIIVHTIAMAHFPQSKLQGFMTPAVPMVPVFGIVINIYLMMRLSYFTLIRFSIWMLIGRCVK